MFQVLSYMGTHIFVLVMSIFNQVNICCGIQQNQGGCTMFTTLERKNSRLVPCPVFSLFKFVAVVSCNKTSCPVHQCGLIHNSVRHSYIKLNRKTGWIFHQKQQYFLYLSHSVNRCCLMNDGIQQKFSSLVPQHHYTYY